MNYYNEFDPHAAGWLRNLMALGLIPDGEVDTRSIVEVQPDDLKGFIQCHFFAGIGGWPLALQLAGWPEDKPVWTGSCPCQPFSVAGKRKGNADERHLWPEMLRLVGECKPTVVFGEQVASKDGREWLSGVRSDLETLGYAVGAADLCAAGAGAPHIRQRLYWVADPTEPGEGGRGVQRPREGASEAGQWPSDQPERGGHAGGFSGMGDTEGEQVGGARQPRGRSNAPGFWGAFDVVPCADGKARRIEPGTSPLAHGVPGRVGKLRGYGNAIVPQVAAEFINAYKGG